MGTWYLPSVKVRKENAGTRCPGCSLYMHHKDMVAWSGEAGTVYIHDQCAEIIFDSAQQSVIHLMESAGAEQTGSAPAEETGALDPSEQS